MFIKTLGLTNLKSILRPLASKDNYTCTNVLVSKGVCAAPASLEECFQRHPSVNALAYALGITGSKSLTWSTPGATYQFGDTAANDLFLEKTSPEMQKVCAGNSYGSINSDFSGCFWTNPEAPFSTNCPEVGIYYPSYLKLRLNIATFWDTPKQTPVRRREFLDSIKYSRKAELVVAGDMFIKVGDVVELKLDNLSGFPYNTGQSVLSGYYWVLSVKHVFTNTGTHETMLRVSQIIPELEETSYPY